MNIKFEKKKKLLKKSLHSILYNNNNNNNNQINQNELANSSYLYVRNFGHENICVSNININEAGIFLLRINYKKELFLNSSIIHIVNRNADHQIAFKDG